MSDLARFAEVALLAARAGAAVAGTGYRQAPRVGKKGRTDLVTEFDLASERAVREALATATPEIAVVGEEQGGHVGEAFAWYVDPIDGTTNFVHGHPFWCVSVGLMRGATPLAGAVVAPALVLEWVGAVGHGARRNGELCRTSHTDSLDDALVATGFPQERDVAPDNNFAAFERVKRRVRGVRRCGSAALDLCLVADGTYDAYWERKLHAWDVAAGAALVLAAGGRLAPLDPSAPDLRRGRLLASNGAVEAALLAVLRDE